MSQLRENEARPRGLGETRVPSWLTEVGWQGLVVLGLLALFVFSLNANILSASNLTAGSGDLHLYVGPAQFFLDSRIAAGDLPLWNPYTISGMPFAANPQSMALYPPNLIRSVLSRPETPRETLHSLHGMTFFHLVLLGLGIQALARQEGISRASSLVVALSLPFSALWMNWINGYLPAIASAAWTPLILTCLGKAFDEFVPRRRLGWLTLGGLLYGLQILAGFPPVALYATFAYIAFSAMKAFAKPRIAAPPHGIARRASIWAGSVTVFGLIGAAGALALVLPAAELISLSTRGRDHFAQFTASEWGVNMAGWERFWNHLRFSGTDLADKWRMLGPAVDEWTSLNLGLLLTALAAALSRHRRRVLCYLALTLILTDLCLGPPMPLAWLFETLVRFQPSSPAYASMLISIPLSILVGFGLDALCVRRDPAQQKHVLLLMLVPGLAAIGLLRLALRTGGLSPWALLPLAVLLAICFAPPRSRRPLILSTVLLETLLLGPVLAERVYEYAYGYSRMEVPQDFLDRPATVLPNDGRTMSPLYNHHLWSLTPAIGGYDPLALAHTFDVLADPGEELHYTRYIQATGNPTRAAFLKRPFWLVPRYIQGTTAPKDRLFPPASVVFLEVSEPPNAPRTTLDDVPNSFLSNPQLQTVLWPAQRRRLRVTGPLRFTDVPIPRSTSALFIEYNNRGGQGRLGVGIIGPRPGQFSHFDLPLAPTGRRAIQQVPLPDFDSMDLLLSISGTEGENVATIERVTLFSDKDDEFDSIKVLKRDPDRAVIDVIAAPEPRILVYTDSTYPGWKATVDGGRVPILPANDAFKAVLVPPGSHRVEFIFEPWRFRVGIFCSLGVFALGLLALPFFFRRNRTT